MKRLSKAISLILALILALSTTAAAENELTVLSAICNCARLEYSSYIPSGDKISIIFSADVTAPSVLDGNLKKIRVRDSLGNISYSKAVAGSDENTVDVFIGEDADGDYTLEIGRGIRDADGNILSDDITYGFTVKNPEPYENNCKCLCHAAENNKFAEFIWSIVCFFSQIFRTNVVCTCGIYHYRPD